MAGKTTSKDVRAAVAVTAAGAVAIAYALRSHWNPQDLDPGVEGCLTVVVVGFVMAMLHPLTYRQALKLCAPMVVAEYLTLRYASGSATALGMAGIELVIMGFAGVALALREPSAVGSGQARPSLMSGRQAPAHS